MSTLPTFEEAVADAKRQPEETKKIALTAMAAECTSEKTRKTLKDEIKALTGSAIAIDEAFERVRLKLIDGDRKGYKKKDGSPVDPLAPGWVELQKRFTVHLWLSRETATETVAYIEDYLTVIVPMAYKPNSEISLDDKKTEIENFMKHGADGSTTQKRAAELSQGFLDLSRDVNAYGLLFDEYAKEQEGAWEKRVEVLSQEISTLQDNLKQYNDRITGLGVGIATTIAATAGAVVGVLIALGPFGPFAAAGIAAAGLAAVAVQSAYLDQAIKDRDETQKSISEKDAELAQFKRNLQELAQVQAELQKAKLDVADICKRLGGFTTVWACVAFDAGLLAEGVKTGLGAQSNYGLVARINLSVQGYTALKEALTDYAMLVDDSGIPKPQP